MTLTACVTERHVNDEAAIPTPALLIDLATAERNARRLGTYAADHGLGVRPHIKTHKSLRIAELQMEAGAVGLTVAKVGEAEVMAAATADLLVGYPALDHHRADRIGALARDRQVRVAVDSQLACDVLARSARSAGMDLGILVDIDLGYRRTGVQGPQAALELAQHIDRTQGLCLDGLFCFPGHVHGAPDEQAGELAALNDALGEVIGRWRQDGLEASIVSGGSTPTAFQSHLVPALTEIRPGTYIYNDWNCVAAGWSELDDCAARVACTVVSEAVPGKVVIDAGGKTLTYDPHCLQKHNKGDGPMGYGYVVEYPAARIIRLTEEHGEVDVSRCDDRPALGDRVHVIPNHICPCVNLQEACWLKGPDGSFEQARVDARGRLS